MVHFIRFIVFIYLSSTGVVAQSFTFADTHPVNKPDSLEQWVMAHPQPSLVRLKTLIQLERTYTWNYTNKVGTYLEEIRQLSQKYHLVVGRAAYCYFKGFYHYRKSQRHASIQHVKESILAFQSLSDTSGLIHNYTLLVDLQCLSFGGVVTNQPFFKQEYLANLNRLLKPTTNIHDYLRVQRVQWSVMYCGDRVGNLPKLEQIAQRALSGIRKGSETSYALYQFSKYLAISYYLQNQIEKSYRQNKEILASLRADQTHELITINYNLSNDCDALKRSTEKALYADRTLTLLKRYDPQDYSMLNAVYGHLKDLALQQGKLREALSLADSMQKYNDGRRMQENDLRMLELQSRYEFERKQKQISKLNQKHHEAGQERQQILLVLSVLVLVILLFTFLLVMLLRAYKELRALNKARERFFGIIAHDLRRPLHAFHGMNKLVSYYLKTQRYDAVETLSESIDKAGNKIQLMLDNLLRWALAQRYELPYYPQTLLLKPQLTDIIDLFQSLTNKYPITFSVDCADTLQIYADPNGVDLILRNLVDNALKAMEYQSGHLRIEAQANQSGQVCIRVSDTGSGLNTAQLNAIRQILRRPEETQLDGNNSGLGLILVSQFTQCNRGQVTVDSSPGAGTTFWLTFPAMR